MRRTIFEGTINGETFDSVQAYNARMNELVNSGEVINASSNTRIEYVDAPTNVPTLEPAVVETPVDEDLSFYPYMDNDDPFYLDILVATDTDQNRAALDEVDVVLNKCLPYIENALKDKNVKCHTKGEYLADVNEIINSLKKDNEDTVKAKNLLLAKRADLTREFNKIKDKYEEDIHNSLMEEILLNGAFPVIDRFIDFYSRVSEIADAEINNCDCNCGKCTCKNVEETPQTEICEVESPKVADIQTLLEHIFGHPFQKRGTL